MKQEIFIYLIGTAGSGKSTMSHSFKQWLQLQGLDSIVVNLDPGAENLPYSPDVDIRDWISLEEVMETYELGPNGAQVACADMLAINTDDIKSSIESFKTDYVIMDTPGQLELFVFRESGKFIIDSLNPKRSVIGYLIDHILTRNPTGFVSHLLLSFTTNFKLGLPQINLLSKTDLLSEEELDRVIQWAKNNELLENELANQNSSIYREVSEQILRIISSFSNNLSMIPVSKEEFKGIDDLYTNIQLIFEGGEDLLSD
jgi:GTPase SAR1 family protein